MNWGARGQGRWQGHGAQQALPQLHGAREQAHWPDGHRPFIPHQQGQFGQQNQNNHQGNQRFQQNEYYVQHENGGFQAQGWQPDRNRPFIPHQQGQFQEFGPQNQNN